MELRILAKFCYNFKLYTYVTSQKSILIIIVFSGLQVKKSYINISHFWLGAKVTTVTTTISTTTTTSIRTTEKSAETTTTPQLFDCNEEDSREILWEAEPWETVNKTCNEGSLSNETFVEGNMLTILNSINNLFRCFIA